MSRDYYRCTDCCTPMVLEGVQATKPLCACGGQLKYVGTVRKHRVVRLEDHPACDGRCTGAIGPSCDCRCGGENHGSGRAVTVVAEDLGPAKVTAVDGEVQLARAKEYRDVKEALDAAIKGCRLAWAFEAYGRGERLQHGAWQAVFETRERRLHALRLKTHNGRIKAIAAVIEHVKKL